LGTLKEIVFDGIGGLYARHGRGKSVFWRAPFFVESLNWAVLGKNWSIKSVLEAFLKYLIRNVNYLAWPDSLSPFLESQT
jgi:hypothetical protein